MSSKHQPKVANYPRNINGTEGKDNLFNQHDKVKITAKGGDDTIRNSGSQGTIYGGAGNDIIDNSNMYGRLYGEDGNDSISNSGYNSRVFGGAGNDSLKNIYNNFVLVNGDTGNDTLENDGGGFTTLNGGAGDDTLINRDPGKSNSGETVKGAAMFMDGGDGNDYIRNDALENLAVRFLYAFDFDKNRSYRKKETNYATINGGAGNDTIEVKGSDVTINGGTGDVNIKKKETLCRV